MDIDIRKQTKNPYLPGWEYIPDGEPRQFGNRVYVYGSHDEARGKAYCMGDYVCWSAPVDDLASWSFEGVIFRTTDDPHYEEEKVLYFAPDVAQGPDGRYYLYYFSSKMDKIGVAVCNTPAGHYRYYGDIRFPDGRVLNADAGYGLPFDPGILSDENGNWLYYGFALQKRKDGFPEAGYAGGFAVKLEDDMLTIADTPKCTIPGKMAAVGTQYEGHAFLEASSIRHYGKYFYLVYSSELGHELCYAYSEYPDRDFIYGGTIVSNGDVGLNGRSEENAVAYLGNNHGGLLKIAEQYYIFYHRHTHGIQYSRQGCIEPICVKEDGSIRQAEITSQGASGMPWSTGEEYSSHLACCLRSKNGILHYSGSVHWNEEHPFISQEDEDGSATLQNQFIYNLKDGAICGFKYLEFTGKETAVRVRVRGNFSGRISLYSENPQEQREACEETNIANIEMQGSKKWIWLKAPVKKTEGILPIYFAFYGAGACDFDAFVIE